ncbi:MAG: hypothetical protein COA78_10560 [Blastopirellula sp.]|nr:MAG: hypothetical protein COA78_10560 [Blastopirellula sp.]
MSDENPYSPPQAEIGPPAKSLVLAQRSRPVHWVAMVTLGLGGISFVVAVILALGCYDLANQMSTHPEEDNQFHMMAGIAFLGFAFVGSIAFLLAILLLTAGFGVWRRKRWAWTLLMVGCLGIFPLSALAGVSAMSGSSPTQLVEYLYPITLLILFAYSFFSLSILLRRKYQAEFFGIRPGIRKSNT